MNSNLVQQAMVNKSQSKKFADLLHQFHGEIFGYIFALVQNQADAEDLYQETVLVLWKKFGEFQAGTHFGRWAIRTAHLNVLNFVRRNRRQRLYFSDEILQTIADAYQQEDPTQRSARARALASCLQRLPDKDRALVDSCYSSNRTMKAVAACHGRSVEAIYKAVSRIRQSLLECIQRTVAAEGRL